MLSIIIYIWIKAIERDVHCRTNPHEYIHIYIYPCVCVLVTVTLCDPMDCSPPDSSVYGILQARILEWVAIPFSKVSSQPRNWTQVFCIAGRFFTIWATREASSIVYACVIDERSNKSAVKESKGSQSKISKQKSNCPSFLQRTVRILTHKSILANCL